MTYPYDNETNPVYASEREERRCAVDALTEMERAHYDEEMHW